MALRLGVDIGGTKVNMGLVDGSGRVLAGTRQPVPREGGCRGALEAVAASIDGLLARVSAARADLAFCGMGVPGTVSPDGRVALKVPNLGWENEPCADAFKEMTGLDARVIQDSRAAALGEYLAGAGRGSRVLVCMTLGTGIGTGIVIDGRVFDGGLGGAGEVGHIQTVPDGRPCGCGRFGCMEKYAAGLGIAQTALEHPAFKGRDCSSEAVFAAALEGHEAARGIIGDAVEKLGRVVVSVVNVLSPDTLIFSGGMCSQEELLVGPLIRYVKDHAYPLSVGDGLRVGVAELGGDAPMVGAALCGGDRT